MKIFDFLKNTSSKKEDSTVNDVKKINRRDFITGSSASIVGLTLPLKISDPIDTFILYRKRISKKSNLIEDVSVLYACEVKNNKITWNTNKSKSIKFKNFNDIEKTIKNDKSLKNIIRSHNFFTLHKGKSTLLDIYMDGTISDNMSKHTFSSKPIMKNDPRYKELKERLYDHGRSKRATDLAYVGVVLGDPTKYI